MKRNILDEPMKTTFTYACTLRLLRLYPRAWRERYADEVAAVLEARPATLRTLFDLFLGLLDAHLHQELFTERKFAMLQRLRNSQVTIFSSFILFFLFWMFYMLIERNGVIVLYFTPHTPKPNDAFVYPIVRIVGLLAILSALPGSCAFMAVRLKESFARDKQNILPLTCTAISILVALTVGLTLMIPQIPHQVIYTLIVVSLLLALMGNVLRIRQGIKNATISWRFMFPTLTPVLIILASIVSIGSSYTQQWIQSYLNSHLLILAQFALFLVPIPAVITGGIIYVSRKIRQATFSPRFLRFTFMFASIATLAMVVVLGLLLFQVVAIDMYMYDNAQRLYSLAVPLLNIIVPCIAVITLVSCISLWRGFQAQRALAVA